MWQVIAGFMLKSKIAKVGGGTIVGSGLFTLLLSHVNSREANLKQYVDLKHEVVISDVIHLKSGQTDIKSLLKKIDERIYQLVQKKGE